MSARRGFLLRSVHRGRSAVAQAYFAATQRHPIVVLTLVALAIAMVGAFAGRITLDASAESLVLENDPELQYYRDIRARYGSDDFVVVTYRPKGDLFGKQAIGRVESLRDDLAQLPRVASVVSFLDAPVLQGQTFSDLRQGTHTVQSSEVDPAIASRAFTTSPLYRNVLVGKNGDIAALYVHFKHEHRFNELLQRRNALREKRLNRELTAQEGQRLRHVKQLLRAYHATASKKTRQNIAAIRGILDHYRDHAVIHLAGVPLIVSDMIRFIRHDLRVFGAGVLVFIVMLLAVAFRRPRWVAVPLLICAATAMLMLGGLGFLEKPLTVVSSNFLPVLLIVTLSLTVHLIVRHEEIHTRDPHKNPRELAAQTMRDKFVPCLYTALTTMVAFGSLAISRLPPVIDFGWLMVIGIACAFFLVFLALPAWLRLLPPESAAARRGAFADRITGAFSRIVERRAVPTLAVAAVLFGVGVVGASRLSVDNRFIDYFDDSTEIYQGMLTVDQRLGGTTPLDVILGADPRFLENQAREGGEGRRKHAGLSGTSYWFNMFRLKQVKKVHDYLDSLPETGKVLSLATSIRVLEQLNKGRPLDNFTLSLIYRKLPENVKRRLLEPYMSDDGNQLRFAVRIYSTHPGLEHDELLRKIRSDLIDRFDFAPGQVRLTGMTVLYNDMLQSLFRSQSLSFGFVLVAVSLAFLAMFRSLRACAIALVPNLLVAAVILGLMGWLGISLDMMTITIAAIAMGIAVDDTIHYMHRFKVEVSRDGDYWAAMRRSHRSVGRAMFYTSLTIALGFSILALSDFVPTITFGLLAGAAMTAALAADLTVLPALLALLKPFGPDRPR